MKSKTADLDVAKHIQSALDVVHPEVSQFTFPLFAVDDRGRPDLYASSVLIECDNNTVLLTAAHGIYQITQTKSDVHIGANSLVALPPNFLLSSETGQDPLDIAAMVLPAEFIQSNSMRALPLARTTLAKQCSMPHMRCVHGYPCTKNTTTDRADEANKIFTRFGFTYAGASRDVKINYARFQKQEDIHVALRYQRKSKNAKGEIVTPPAPKDMSGGGLWSVPDSFIPQTLFLEGIAVEFRDKSLVFATRIEHAVDFIRQYVLPSS